MDNMCGKISLFLLISWLSLPLWGQVPAPVSRLLSKPYMKGASFSLLVKEVESGRVCFAYDTLRQLTPASVMKTLTTATALELLGEEYRYPTTIAYDGTLRAGVLHGNLYIQGGGDPSLGSSFLPEQPMTVIRRWIAAVKEAGIRRIEGAVVADESLFDTEGTSPKWVAEDLGNYYGAGSFGLNIFDNRYQLFLRSGAAGSRPKVERTFPEVEGLRFHNYLTAAAVASDSAFITGGRFSPERYLYGVIPANKERYVLKGDIPDPTLFLARFLTRELRGSGVEVSGDASCHRLLREAGRWRAGKHMPIVTTHSPSLALLARVTNHASHNLYADALLKTIGTHERVKPGEVISSFEKGVRALRKHWAERGLDLSTVWMTDGSGLAITNKLSTAFLVDMLIYMKTRSPQANSFFNSLPRAGEEGSVRSFLRGTTLQGNARLKSGSMSRVKGYAGYIRNGGKWYAVALLANNYSCEGSVMTREIGQLLVRLFE